MKKILSIVALCSTLLYSDTGLSLENAIKILKKNNTELKIAEFKTQIAKQNEIATEGIHFGKLTFNQEIANSNDAGNVFGFTLASREADFGDFGLAELDMTDPNVLKVQPKTLNYPEARNLFKSSLTFKAPIFTGFKISNYSKILKLVSNIKNIQKQELESEKVTQLKSIYYDISLINSTITDLREILDNVVTLETAVENMIEVGYAKKIDLVEVKSKKENIKKLILNMQANKKLSYSYIDFLLNQHITKIQNIDIENNNTNINKYTESENFNNFDIQKIKNNIKIQHGKYNVAKAAYYPQAGIKLEVSTADDTFLGDMADHASYTVGIGIKWNLYNGGIDSANIQKAKIDTLKAESELALATSGIKLKIKQIKTEISNISNDIEYYKKVVGFSKEIYENYSEQYKEKLISISNVIIKQSELINNTIELKMAYNKRNKKILELEKLLKGNK